MDRLTDPAITNRGNDPWDLCWLDKDCRRDCKGCKLPAQIYRLAMYEDTGLDPAEIEALNLIVDVPDSKIPAAKPEEAQDLDLEREFQQAMEWLRQETIDNQRDLINRQRAFIDLLLRKLKEEEPDDGH